MPILFFCFLLYCCFQEREGESERAGSEVEGTHGRDREQERGTERAREKSEYLDILPSSFCSGQNASVKRKRSVQDSRQNESR